MKTRHLLIIFVVLFLVFIGIWIVSPNVGERVEPEKGVDVEFNEQNDDLPTNLPEGFVLCCAICLGKTNETFEEREIPDRISKAYIK